MIQIIFFNTKPVTLLFIFFLICCNQKPWSGHIMDQPWKMKIWCKILENAELFVPKMRFHCYLCSKSAELLIRIVITHLGSCFIFFTSRLTFNKYQLCYQTLKHLKLTNINISNHGLLMIVIIDPQPNLNLSLAVNGTQRNSL